MANDAHLSVFPAAALPRGDGAGFGVSFTAWLYRDARADEGSVPKRILHRLIRKHVTWSADQIEIFEARSGLFLRAGLGRQPVAIYYADEEVWRGLTNADGFVYGTMALPAATLAGNVAPQVRVELGDRSYFSTLSLTYPHPSPFVVVSDIDDTLKLSAVWNVREMLAKTFAEPFKPIPEVARCFRQWEAEGAEFHYVSTSPWQLYEPLLEFLSEHGFPKGTLHLRRLNWRRPNPFSRRGRTKVDSLVRLLGAYPERRFILVGDDVEKDPELYARVAREFPGQVDKVFIRNVREERGSIREFHRSRASTLVGSWQSFADGDDLSQLLAR